MFLRLGAIGVAFAFTTGCLSPHYTVRRDELERLANAPPAERTEVHAKQRIVFSPSPEDLTPETMLRDTAEAVETAKMAAQAVAIARDAARQADEAVNEPPKDEKKEEPKDEQKKENEKKDDSKALVVVLVVVGGVFIGAALAGSEGARYDGRFALPADRPIHLRNDAREIGWVHASKLTPAMLADVTEGVVSDADGPLVRLGRAPLDRRGFTYGVELGAGGMNDLARDLRVGFAGRIGIGYFPAQAFGVLAGTNLQTGPKGDQATAIDVRPYLELQLLPVRGGGFHGGVYGEAGRSFGSERLASGEERSTSSWALGGGLLVQRELTTLLALTLRGGVVALPEPGPATQWAPLLTLGIAVY